jgi:accessory gene regulator B
MCSINKYLTEKMIDYHIIEPEDIEIYTYGLTNGFIIIANILTTLLFACLIEKIDIAIIMLLSFIPLRSFSGGMHCKSKTACYMISNIIILILLIAQNYFLKFPLFLLCITLISGIYIFFNKISNSDNRTLDNQDPILQQSQKKYSYYSIFHNCCIVVIT